MTPCISFYLAVEISVLRISNQGFAFIIRITATLDLKAYLRIEGSVRRRVVFVI